MARRVLLADDKRYIRELVEMVLHLAGFEVLLAGDGADSLRLARLERPDAVLLDIVLPRLDGRDVCDDACDEIRADPELRDTLVIYFSSIDEDELRKMRCADAYHTKGNLVGLAGFLTELLEGRGMGHRA
jgi:two-component system, OmpR family, alkaline phosphatase synthesis response regulator PhoP